MPKSKAKPKPKPQSTTHPSISPSFTAHKSAILSALSQPSHSYSDLSPKGSVDHQIADLITDLNSLPGIVTTSSCSGRIAVFVEGYSKTPSSTSSTSDLQSTDKLASEDSGSTAESSERNSSSSRQKAVPGGKGLGGKWLFVSHDPLSNPLLLPRELEHLFELEPSCPDIDDNNSTTTTTTSSTSGISGSPRLIHLLFSPLILHLCTASLHHAKPLLALAIQAGFRESGVQSLKCLDDTAAQQGRSWPMLAIRSAGLGWSSVVGYVDQGGRERACVSRDVMLWMVGVANGRFAENEERAGRLRGGVRLLLGGGDGLDRGIGDDVKQWEDKEVRRLRMSKEGKRRQAEVRRNDVVATEQRGLEDEDHFVGLSIDLPP